MARGFQILKGWIANLPKRSTKLAAGYDIEAAENVKIQPHGRVVIGTGLCAYMLDDEVLKIYVRSSLGIKRDCTLSNGTAIIDADYVYASNGGHIMIALSNNSNKSIEIKKGERVAQGIFSKYLLADGDNVETIRTGGIGSTGL